MEKTKNEKLVEMMMEKIAQMEDNHWNVGLSMKEKGFILEKTRLMSMEFTKLKTSVMKSKMNYDDRTKVLNFLKPFDQRIKEILNIS